MKQEIIKQDQIGKVYDFLYAAYNATKSGYTQIALSNIARDTGVSTTSTIAVKNLNIMKQTGLRKQAKWFWNTTLPDQAMAQKMYTESLRIQANVRLKKREGNLLQQKGLVPIIKKDSSYRAVVDLSLRQMFKNSNDLQTVQTVSKLGLTPSSFKALIDLDILKEHKHAKNHFKWSYGYPTSELVDLIASAVEEKQVLPDTVKDIPVEIENKQEETVVGKNKNKKYDHTKLLDLLNEISDNQPYQVTAAILLDKHKVTKSYMSKAVSLGIVKNIGSMYSPKYTTTEKPTIELCNKIHAEVCLDWKEGSRKKLMKKNGIIVNNAVVVEPVTAQTEPKTEPVTAEPNYVDMLQRTLKRKTFLETELEKVNKVIDAINTVNNLYNEIITD